MLLKRCQYSTHDESHNAYIQLPFKIGYMESKNSSHHNNVVCFEPVISEEARKFSLFAYVDVGRLYTCLWTLYRTIPLQSVSTDSIDRFSKRQLTCRVQFCTPAQQHDIPPFEFVCRRTRGEIRSLLIEKLTKWWCHPRIFPLVVFRRIRHYKFDHFCKFD